MNHSRQPSRPLQVFVWMVLGLVIIAIGLLYFRYEHQTQSDLKVISEVKDFVLTNQLQQVITLDDLHGKVWIADIVFTRCGGPCPRMTEKMSALQTKIPDPDLNFVTLTTDPDWDKPPVLKAFAEKFNADHSRWLFLTGTKEQIRQLAVNSLKLTAIEKEQIEQQDPNDLFVHSTIFVVVDKRGRVRSIHESLEEGFEEKITGAVKSLLREKAP